MASEQRSQEEGEEQSVSGSQLRAWLAPRREAAAAAPPVRRRPAAAGEDRGGLVWVPAQEAKLEDFEAGCKIVAEGEYWEGKADVCGEIVGARVDGTHRYLRECGRQVLTARQS